MSSSYFDPDASLLLVVDVQERLWPHIANKDQVRDRCAIMTKAAQHLDVPVIVSEQYPKGLGPTLAALRECRRPQDEPYVKTAFGCLGDAGLARAIRASGRRQLVVCGIETHVCVLQTVLEALSEGFRVGVVADAVGSRAESNRHLGLARMRDAGAVILSSEMIIFEWLRDARHPAFKAISALIK
jgi:nicotinamidase-related amidase